MKSPIKTLLLWASAAAALALASCSGGEASRTNSHVETFTTGTVSRTETIKLYLNQDIPQDVWKSVDWEDVISFSPSAKGTFASPSPNLVTFTPDPEFDRDTEYTVTVKMSKLFTDLKDGEKKFAFDFKTLPLDFIGSFETLWPSDDEKKYTLAFNITTADKETNETVEKSITASEGELECENESDQSFTCQVTVDATTEDRTLSITFGDKELATAQIPSINTLRVCDVKYVNGDQKYIEVTFSKKLDRKQKMSGLAYIEGNGNTTVDVIDNKLRLYPDISAGDVTVFLSANIKSVDGKLLGEDKSMAVTLEQTKPAVQFTSKGTVIPVADKVTIPFRSVHLKAVRVRVFRIFKSNIGSMLQENELNGAGNLARYGQPVAVKTIFLDESEKKDLSRWHTFAIDMSQIMKTEQGAMYRIELAMDPNFSTWPGAEADFDKEKIAMEDQRIFDKLVSNFNSGETWYNPNDNGYDYDYDWQKQEDPDYAQYYYNRYDSRNVLTTNIGLTSISNGDGKIRVFALNIPDSNPCKGVELTLFNLQNREMATGKTDENGIADLTYDIKSGAPLYIRASDGVDVSYLRLRESLSTSSFDVSGDEVQHGMKGYLYGERGVWRPGDTIHVALMIQAIGNEMPANHPVTLNLTTPVGQLYATKTSTNGPMGLYTFNIPTNADAPTGVWTATAVVGSTKFTKSIRVETIKPNRLKIDLDLPSSITSHDNKFNLHTEWLTGAKAHDLKYEVTATMLPTKTSFGGYRDYVFDDPTKKHFSVKDEKVTEGVTDGDGNASVAINYDIKDNAPGMLTASFTTRVFEPSGEFSTDQARTTYSPYSRYVGIKSPQNGSHQLDTDKDHTFQVVTVDSEGKAAGNTDLDVSIYQVEYWWWWSSSDYDMANYTANSWNKPVKESTIKTDAKGHGSFKFRANYNDWGTYLIMVKDKNGSHSSGLLAYFDWPNGVNRRDGGMNAAEALSISTDKKEYSVGDQMSISFPSAEGAHALVNICRGGSIVRTIVTDCKKGTTQMSVDITEEMLPNAYVVVNLIQPYANSANDNPIRLYGVTPVTVTSAKSHITPQISCADAARPLQKMSVTVNEKDGRPMTYTLAVVDEGLLDLTRFKTPNAWGLFNAREAFGLKIWDLYRDVAGAFGGRIEQLFSIGGDEGLNNGPKAIVNRFTPMVHFSGSYTIGQGEKKTHSIDIPNYNGRVRVMVVATDGQAAGNAEKSVKVSKPLMLLGTMPRQIGVGDKSTVSATIFTDRAMGDVTVNISAKNGVKVVGNSKKTVKINSATDQTVSFEIEAGANEGEAIISLSCSAKGEKADYTTKLKIRKESQLTPRTEVATIKAGKEWTSPKVSINNGEYVNSTFIDISSTRPLNLSQRLKYLVGYPHGCAEQTTSKAFAQLYLQDFAQLPKEQAAEIEANIKAGISRLNNFTTTDGGMAYWAGNSNSDLWASAYIYLFLSEANAKGYYVSKTIKTNLAQYLRNQVRGNWGKNTLWYGNRDIALALYALANDQKAESSAMNRLKESIEGKQVNYCYSETCNLLAAAYAKIGSTKVARDLALKGKESNDNATSLLAQALLNDAEVAQTAESLRQKIAEPNNWMSTYETAMGIMAWRNYIQKRATSSHLSASVSIDGSNDKTSIDTDKCTWRKELNDSKVHSVKVANTSNGDITVLVTTYVKPDQGDVNAQNNGLEVKTDMPREATYTAGEPVKATVTVTPTSLRNDIEKVAITFAVPTGMEILGVSSEAGIDHFDVRDDRVLAYVTDNLKKDAKFTVRMSATYAGEYYAPAIDARMMYDDKVQGNTASGHVTIK